MHLLRYAQNITFSFWTIFQSFSGILNAFIEILFCNFSHRPRPGRRILISLQNMSGIERYVSDV